MNAYLRLFLASIVGFIGLLIIHLSIFWTIFHILQWGHYFKVSLYVTTYVILSLGITKFCSNIISRVLYYIFAIWLGLAVFLVAFICVYDIVSLFVTLSKVQALFLIIFPSVSLFIYGYINARNLKIKTVDVQIKGLSASIKIAHLSDVHLGAIYHKEYAEFLVEQIKSLNPDFVAITGDLFDGSMKLTPDMVEPFNDLPMNVYFVVGNHDSMVSGEEEMSYALSKSKIIAIRNEVITHNNLNIIGFDYSHRRGNLVSQLKKLYLPDSEANILLYHVPEEKAEVLDKFNIHLHLAGHTHAGQFPPFNIPPRLLYSYLDGLHKSEEGNCYVYVTDGTGTSGPPLRIFSESNISLITLHS